MSNVAAKVRAEKEANPERFCAVRKCLWRIVTKDGPNPCRNHPVHIIHTNVELGLRAHVTSTVGGYRVRVEDVEADEVVPTSVVFPSIEAANVYALVAIDMPGAPLIAEPLAVELV